MLANYKFLLPPTLNIKIILIKNSKITLVKYILYNKWTAYSFVTTKNKFFYDAKTHSLVSKNQTRFKNTPVNFLFKRTLQFFLFSLCWKNFKIIYTGKGYKIRKYKRTNFIDLTFGACHFVKASLPNQKIKFRRKRALVIKYKYPFLWKYNFAKLLNVKPLNLYTQRGLKNSKNIIFRKPKTKATFI